MAAISNQQPTTNATSRPAGRTLLVEGGGLRGAFAAGVLYQLAQRGVHFDDVVAVSAGAPTATYLAAGQAHDCVTIWRHLLHGRQLIAFRNLLRGKPIMDIAKLVSVFEHTVPLQLAALAQATTRVWVGVTSATTGQARYLRVTPTNVFPLMHAAMALPVANGRVIRIADDEFVDGGVAAPIPLAFAQSLGNAHLTCVLTRPAGYRRRSNPLALKLAGATYPRYPALRQALLDMEAKANHVLSQLENHEQAGALGIIRPLSPLPVGRLTRKPAAIQQAIELGMAAGQRFAFGR